MKHFIAATFMTFTTAFTAASAIEQCDERYNTLYKEIQIYNKTEKTGAGMGLVGRTLQSQINTIRGETMTLKEKVYAVEASFAKCDVQLSEDDHIEIEMAGEADLKMKNPYNTEE